MAGLVLLVLMFLMFFSITSAMARAGRGRRMLEEEALRQRERARQRAQGSGPAPSGSPFGNLLQAMLGGAGAWTQTVEFDEQAGHWRDVAASQAQTPSAPTQPAAADPTPRQPQFTRKSPPRRASAQNPLSTLLGGAMGGATGEFTVEPPDGLVTFKQVGGMGSLKQEVRDTVGLLLEHPK
jgi:hypothetical protein